MNWSTKEVPVVGMGNRKKETKQITTREVGGGGEEGRGRREGMGEKGLKKKRTW